ncbi:non-ribosomal peptide synthase/polyketide synthase, partial [Gordonia sp. NPDC003950]
MNRAFARMLGSAPATTDLLAFAAIVAPGSPAFTGPTGQVTFGELNARVAPLVGVFEAQGMESDAAVRAGITPVLVAGGVAPADAGEAATRAIAEVRRGVLELVRSTDLGSLPGVFRSVAARFQDRPAVTDSAGTTISYRELDERSDALAAGLIADGAGPQTCIGIALPRDAELIIALLGVVKTGAAYLPLDRSHPRDRLATIIADAGPLLVLADGETIADWAESPVPFVTVEAQSARSTAELRGRIPARVDPAHPAYIIYTSGSTGTPKGVAVAHRALVSLFAAMGREYDYSHDDVWSMCHSYAFDLSVGEIWMPLAVGGRLVVVDSATTRDPAALVDTLEREHVSVVNLTPSAFYQLAAVVREPARRTLPRSLRSMIFVGEALDFEQVRRWYTDRQAADGDDGPELNNMYGPTEATVYMTRRRLSPQFVAESAGDVGTALPGSRVYVLDSRLAKVPDGVPGDLYIAGDQLAIGYAGRFGMNATRFVADPFGAPGDRMYLSGDVALFRDGSLRFLGRADDQVKLRGYRIELGEVEAALLSAPGVDSAAAAIKPRAGGTDRLVGYVVPGDREATPLDGAAIRRSAASKVPDYMVPDTVMVLDELPLNVNGKLDRRALPEPVFVSSVDYVAPASPVEERLAAIVSEVLGVERLSVIESFHDLGGSSLLAARIVGRASEDLGVELNLRDLFEAPTVREFAIRAADAAPSLAPITAAVPRPEIVPLSFAQQRMWFINQFDPSVPTYNIPVILRLTGDVDVAALRAAVADVVVRQEILRTTFPAVEGQPRQVVSPIEAVAAELVWREVLSADDLARTVTEGFDVTEQWPLRVVLQRIGPGELVFGVVVHHIAADGESMLPLVADILAAYVSRREGRDPEFAPLRVQFADYAIWQHEVLGSADDADSVVAQQVRYWRSTLAGVPDVLELPTDRPRPQVPSTIGAEHHFAVPAEVAARIGKVAREFDLTPFMVVHAALSVLLARLSATEDIAIVTPIAGRGQAALDHLVGMFVNTLVLRTVVNPDESFASLVERVRVSDLDAFANADVPFETVVDAVDPVRSEAFAPIAQVMLSFDPAASVSTVDASVAGVQVTELEPPFVPAQVDLTFRLHSARPGSDWSGVLVFATDLFDDASGARMAQWFVGVLSQLTAETASAVGDVVLLDDSQESAVLAISTGPVVGVPSRSIADLVADRVAASPDAKALVFAEREVSYREFGARVASLARQLIGAGVGPEVAVGICMDRSVELLVAVHAVTAAGGRYVPLDVQVPSERAAVMLATAGAELVLVAAHESRVSGLAGIPVTLIEVDASGAVDMSVAPVTDAERVSSLREPHGLYTLYTSGSTGVPKGVTVSHGAVANRLSWMADDYGLDSNQRFLLKTPYTFDVSVWELFLPMIVGAPLVIAVPDGHRDPQYLARVIAAEQVSVVHFVPSMLSVFVDVLGDRVGELTSLQYVFTSGEALTPVTAHELLAALPAVALVNLYGPTEAAVDVTAARIRPGDESVTIGRPVANTSTYVLDRRLNVVPVGVPGELYLGGVQLARGYAAQPALTAQRFVADPFALSGGRLYRTGDLVRWNASGAIEYLGRTDFQVKLRGQRIELGEIEAVIAGAPGVVHAAATVAATEARGEFLVGYVSPATVDMDAIKAYVASHLPEYMRPTVWTLMSDVVLSTSGKLDRRALPAPDFESLQVTFVAPEGEAEVAVAAVFADLLGHEQVSVTESFFDLGGNSLSAMRLVARVGAALDAQVSVRDVFGAPSVRALVAAAAGRTSALPPVRAVPRPEQVPLSFAQLRMWFINRLQPELPTYNIPAVLRLTGDLDVAAMRAALVDVVARHQVLRTTFPDVDGVPFQRIAGAELVDDRLDWRVVDSQAEVMAAVMAGFDVTSQWPLRVRLWQSAPGEHVLAVVAHHIAFDGESIKPMIADIVTAYLAESANEVPQFSPLTVQYADYAIWQHEVLGSPEDPESVIGAQLAYWKGQLLGLPPVLELPTDRPRPAALSGRGARVAFQVNPELADRIRGVARSASVTPFMVVHAALTVLLGKLSGTADIAIVTPVAGRGQPALDPLVGMFVNTLVLRTEYESTDTFRSLLESVRRTDLDAFAHADVPFESVVEAVDPVRSRSFAPLAQVMLTFNTDRDHVADSMAAVELAGGLSVSPVEFDDLPAKVDLDVELVAGDRGPFTGTITYETDLFEPTTVEEFAARLVSVLDAVTQEPMRALGRASALLPDERAAVAGWEAGDVVDTVGGTVADAVAAQVSATPNAVALVFEGREVTFAEFGARVAVLARELVAAGVGPDVAVVVCIDRSVELLVALHAVVAAGGQYVPVAPDTPADRAAYMAETAGTAAVLIQAGVRPAALAGLAALPVVQVDADVAVDLDVAPVDDSERLGRLLPDHAVYTIYTSGSTGRPKGVTVSHRSFRHILAFTDDLLSSRDVTVAAHKTPFTFDASVWELFWTLISGAKLVIARPGSHRDVEYLAELIHSEQIGAVDAVPAVWSALFEENTAARAEQLSSLRCLIAGGEALLPSLATLVNEVLPHTDLINQYGPTETTKYVLNEIVEAGAPPLVGRPIWNTTVRVLDVHLEPVPVGVPGELYVGGIQVARGYAGQPRLTAERFVADPQGSAGDRLYRTGDLVRWTSDGRLDYIGRTDFQVKLHGQRLELGEVEAAIAAVPGVGNAAVRLITGASGARLVGYVTPATVDTERVAADLARRLPEYMVPTAWIASSEMPLSSAGKIDRRALPEPTFEAVEYVGPGSDAERQVAEIYAALLGVERVSVTESFFDAGGNSLSAMRLVARVSEALDVEVSVRDVFDAPTVRELVAEVSGRSSALPPVTAVVPRPQHIPLSLAQQRMWYVNQLDPASAAYNIPIVLRLSGPLDASALRAAVGDLVRRHEILRTRFPAVDGRPEQQVAPADAEIDWQIVESQGAVEEAAATGFDVSSEFSIRVRLWQVSADEHVVAVVANHIASDGESLAPLITDLVAAYQARHDGREPQFEPLVVQFADFALWQQRVLGSTEDPDSVVGRQLAYWTEQLRGVPEVIDLPTDRPRPAVAGKRGARWDFDIPDEVAARIGALAQSAGATEFMVVHAALAVLLSRLSAERDIAIGTPVAGRGQAVLDPLIGMFVNTLVLRTQIDADVSFADVLAGARATDLDAFANADVAFDSIVEAVGANRSAAFAPLSQVWLTFDQQAVPELAGANLAAGEVAGLRVSPVVTESVPARVDLLISVMPADEGAWSGSIIYATDLFDETTVAGFARRLVRVLDSAVADTAVAVGDITLDDVTDLAAVAAAAAVVSAPAESAPAEQVIDEEAAKAVVTGGPGSAPELLSEVFTAAARSHPMRQAVVDSEGATLTYAELDARSNRLARWLIARGIGTEDRVALAIGRSAVLLTAIWAVAKTGGAYVPIDPNYPPERVATMVEDSGAVLGVSLAATADLPEREFEWTRIDDPAVAGEIAGLADGPLTADERLRPVRIDNTAYMIYTSGSTGRPKAVVVSHRGLANFAREEVRLASADEYSRVLGFASPSFDGSVLEYLLATVSGGALIYRAADAVGGTELADYIMRQAVTHIFLTPTVLATLDPAVLPTLRTVYVGGEAVPPTLRDTWAPLRRTQTMYGPTETTIVVSISTPMSVGEPVSMGGPIAGVGFVVLDNRLRPVPVGVPGDLYILGGALARGYFGRPGLTSDRFVATPFGAPGARMYRTGDVVRWRQNAAGQLVADYVGRSDDQVKLRGLRIETGEVEAALTAHPAVKSAVVVGIGTDGRPVDVGVQKISALAGYVVLTEPVEMTELRSSLVERLPDYMVPASLMPLDVLPLTPVGKLDRRALPAPERGLSAEYEPPRTQAETQLAAIVAGLLGVEQVSVTESFFALGGDSIMSIQLASAARAAGITLSPREIFEHKTIRKIAAVAGDTSTALADLAEPVGEDGRVPLLPIVSWMLELSDTPEDFDDFSQSVVLVAPAGLTIAALGEMLDAVIAAHPMLGASLTEVDGEWVLQTGVGHSGVTGLTSASRVGGQAFDDDLVSAFEQASARLDPARGRNVEAVLVADADGPARVVLVIHHLVVDAVSWRAVVEDLITTWVQRSAGQPYLLRPEVTSVRAWATALSERTAEHGAELDHWLARCTTTDLGVEFDRRRDRAATVQTVVEEVPAQVTESILTTIPQAFGGAVNDPLIAALARAVRSWQRAHGIADDAPVALLVEGHGRYEEVVAQGANPVRADLSRTVGWFTTIAPFLVDPSDDVEHAVKAAKEERRAAPDQGIGFGLLRFGASPELAARPLPTISFNYLGNVSGGGVPEGDGPGGDLLPAADAPMMPGTVRGAMVATSVLTVNVGTVADEAGRRFSAVFGYPGALFESAAITDLARRWTGELAAIVAHVDAVGDPGLSPSDVAGTEVTQHDLDLLADRYPGAAVWPLTPLQRGFVFQAEFVAGAESLVDVYVAQAVLHLDGEVDIDRLHRAAQALLDHHRVLRSGYVRAASGTVVAVVPPRVDVGWEVVDLDDATDEVIADRVAEIADAERCTPFDLATPPLIRLVAVRTDSGLRLVVTSHHILIDGWSSPLLIADLLALYATGETYTGQINTAGTDFADFLALPAQSDDRASLAAWRELLAPLSGPTLVSRVSEATVDAMPRDHAVVLESRLSLEIEQLARERGVTVAVILQFAWAVVLSRLTGNQVVAFGETVSGRPAELDGVDAMVGLFINTLPSVVDVDPDATIGEVLDRLHTARVAVLDHQHLGLSEIMAAVGAPVLFDTLAVHESYPVDADSIKSADSALGGNLAVADVWSRDATHYPLSFVTAKAGDCFELKLKYLPTAFDDDRVAGIVAMLTRILDTVVHRPDAVTADIALADEHDYRREIVPPVAATPNAGRTLVDLFADSVVAFADRGAVTASGLDGASDTLDYRALDARSSQIAASLVARGVAPGHLVGVATGRTTELVATILGVLKTGAAYLPLDTTNPAERLAYIVADAQPTVVVVDSSTAALEVWDRTADSLVVDVATLTGPAVDSGEISFAPARVPAQARAYVIYTSGSTGRPKGVEITHADIVTLLDTAAGDFEFRHDDVWTMFHSYAFDFSVWELFGPLVTGARVVVVDRDLARDPQGFAGLLAAEEVTVLSQTPSAFYQFAEAVRRRAIRLSLRYIVFGGEELSFEQVRRWFDDHPDDSARLINMYGITETTVHVSFRSLDRDDVVAGDPSFIGRPLSSLGIHILDSRLRPVPDGVVGEMYVTGGQLAQGYLNRPELTAARFVADPYSTTGARMYRTGDLARRAGFDIEYLGRSDTQVQLRGFRIEFGEIEAAMLAASGVVAAAARLADVGTGGTQLVGYVVADEGVELDTSAVRERAARSVPGYMVPDQITVIGQLPLTANGKLDRAALPVPDALEGALEYVAPTSPVEQVLAEVIADVLGVDRVSTVDSFFDIGGNSLSATRVAARASDMLRADISVRDVFATPTVRALAAAVDAGAGGLAPVTAVVARPERVPLSFAQRRMWFINRLEPDLATYNIPTVLRLTGDLDVDSLRAAVADVVARHEVLRTTYPDVDGVPFQQIATVEAIAARLDFQTVSSRALIEAAVVTGFDVSSQWPLRVRLWQAGEREYLLAVVVHHIAADGESMKPLVVDLVSAYGARAAGAAPVFEPLPVQFADFAIWQHEVLGTPEDPQSVVGRQLEFWRAALTGAPDVVDLPVDRVRPAVASGRGARLTFAIPPEVGARVSQVARERALTPFMVVHAALSVVLARLAGTDDVSIGTPIAGRGQAVLEPLVGMFVNTLVLRTAVESEVSFGEFLELVKRTDLDAFAHADVPFEAVVDAVDPVRSEAFAPLTQVLLSFDPGASLAEAGVAVAGLEVSALDAPEVAARVDLTFTVASAGEGDEWLGSVDYATDLFDEATAARIAGTLVRVLDAGTSDTATAIGDIPLIDDAEAADLLPVRSGPGAVPVVLRELFAKAADDFTDRLAVTDAGGLDGPRSFTYAELDARSDRLAGWLTDRGIGVESLVALAIPRSVELLTAIWAVAKAGAGWVPIDPDYPAERVAHMVADSAAVLGLTIADASAGLPHDDIDWIVLDAPEVSADIARSIAPEGPVEVRLQNVAYLIYTSGSTGRPKGVSITHMGLSNWATQNSALLNVAGADPVVLGYSSPSFDASVLEILLATVNGGTLAYRPAGAVGGEQLEDFMRAHRVTHAFLTPSVAATLAPAGLPSVQDLAVGGEAVPQAVIDAWSAHTRVHNVYGPTEATIWVTTSEPLVAGEPVVLGPPIGGLGLAVLDARLRPVPVGVAGEVYVAGSTLARGYHGRPELTADRFVADPYGAHGARMYRTGDLARWRDGADGHVVLDYIGRSDFQVQLRGVRIELGEIEAVLAAHAGVDSAVVVGVGGAAATALAAYVVAETGLDVEGLREHVRTSLPSFMVPSTITVLDDLPLTPVGKIDRKALPAPEFGGVAAEFVAPEGDAEVAV